MTASLETLMRQAPMTISDYLDGAVSAIDKQFGDGYAKANPELVAGFIKACAMDFNSMVIKQAIDDVSSAINSCTFYDDN